MTAGKTPAVPNQYAHAKSGRFGRLDRIDDAILNQERFGLLADHPDARPAPHSQVESALHEEFQIGFLKEFDCHKGCYPQITRMYLISFGYPLL
jgi:hypothetical protein